MLPRLLYLGDVPVESSYHGSALLHRLLADYPPEQLLILETGAASSKPERRMPNVNYYLSRPLGRQRWFEYDSCLCSRVVHADGKRSGTPSRIRSTVLRCERVDRGAWVGGWRRPALRASETCRCALIVHDDWPRVRTFLWGLS